MSDEVSDAGVQPSGQGESVEQVTESQPSGQGERGPSPWANDLQNLGLDPDSQKAVDDYLARQWQPRMTELEQAYAPFKDKFESPEDAQHAADLLYMYRDDPQAAHQAVGEMLNEMVESGQITPAEAEEAKEQMEDQAAPALSDEHQKLLDDIKAEREAAQNQKEFDILMEQVRGDIPQVDETWFAKMVIANNGDVDQAIADYKELLPAHAAVPEPPPPTAGEEGSSAPSMMEDDMPKTLKDAINNLKL